MNNPIITDLDKIYDYIKNKNFYMLNLNVNYHNIYDCDIVALVMDLYDKNLITFYKHQLTKFDKFDKTNNILITKDAYYVESKYFQYLLNERIKLYQSKTYNIIYNKKIDNVILSPEFLVSAFSPQDKNKIILMYNYCDMIQYIEIFLYYCNGDYGQYNIEASYTNMYTDTIYSRIKLDDSFDAPYYEEQSEITLKFI
jgi:hypothetical protein